MIPSNMAIEIPFDTKYIPDQALEVAQRYAQLSGAVALIDPLQRYLEGVAAVPKFEAVALQLMPPTLNESGLLILTGFRIWGARRKDTFDHNEYMSEYLKLRNVVRKQNPPLGMTTMFLYRDLSVSVGDAMKGSLEDFFEPEPLNFGYHPVNPFSDALPTVTLAIVNRTQVPIPTRHRVNASILAVSANRSEIVQN